MKYMLLMQFSAAFDEFPMIYTWQPEEVQAHIGFMRDLNAKLAAAGELVEVQGLGGPEQAKIVRAGADGRPVVTEGPFAETKEFLAGYWIVDVESPERAVEIAALASTAPGPGGRPLHMPIEVHPVMSAPPQDM
ncbi:YciI family protein [Micromonospora echinospora]|uniref:YciI family protein n=1 Tax=Micromonospora echinospora TaxID=1877 RepID=UPI00379AE16E